jgi:hypothetical protein
MPEKRLLSADGTNRRVISSLSFNRFSIGSSTNLHKHTAKVFRSILTPPYIGRTALIYCGTSWKIGLEFGKEYSALSWKSIAVRRKPKEVLESKTTAKKNSDSVDVLTLDVCGETSAQDLADTMDGRPIDLLIHNAAIYRRAHFLSVASET